MKTEKSDTSEVFSWVVICQWQTSGLNLGATWKSGYLPPLLTNMKYTQLKQLNTKSIIWWNVKTSSIYSKKLNSRSLLSQPLGELPILGRPQFWYTWLWVLSLASLRFLSFNRKDSSEMECLLEVHFLKIGWIWLQCRALLVHLTPLKSAQE